MDSSVNLSHDGISLESMRESFATDGFVVFNNALNDETVRTLQSRLEIVLRGTYNRQSPPDKVPKFNSSSNATLGYEGNNSSQKSKVLQIINIHKSDKDFRQLATSQSIGRMVAELAGWERGARLAQDQVWAKPPGAPPLCVVRVG